MILLLPVFFLQCSDTRKITKSVWICSGDVNGVYIHRNGEKLVIYGDPDDMIKKTEKVLFTHYRRDVIWAGQKLVQKGSLAVIPAQEKPYFTRVDSIWEKITSTRFHDYYCQTTKIGILPLEECRTVSGEEILKWQDINIKILNTPGFTRGSISYIADIDGKRFAFVGDLIYGNGKILDLYSFQDSLNGIRGYHGYAVRLGQLVSSLQLIAEEKPDFIIPSRGSIITDPDSSIQNLIRQVRLLYKNYLSICAYRWYFPESMKILSDHVIGPSDNNDFMPFSSVIQRISPSWYSLNANSRLIFAEDSSAFLIDCGMKDVFENLMKLKQCGRLKSIDGIFVTHYHDDHTDYINDVVEEFKCPVYITKELKDILENPGAYNMPCLTTDPISNLTVIQDRQKMQWKDFTLTFYFFPGQTLYHDAVLFEKINEEAIFFIGDSFTPSGIDDYCLLNRNLLHQGMGYFYCLDILKDLPDNVLLCNQHVEPLFAFSRQQLDYMINTLVERKAILKNILPWDNINYGIDGQWAGIYPYGQKADRGQTVDVAVKIFNHSDVSQTFILKPNLPVGFSAEPGINKLIIDPLNESETTFKLKVSEKVEAGLYLVTVDIEFSDWNLHEWCEAIIKIEPAFNRVKSTALHP